VAAGGFGPGHLFSPLSLQTAENHNWLKPLNLFPVRALRAQICRELDRLELVIDQIKVIEDERDALTAAQAIEKTESSPVTMLLQLRSINRRQVAAYAGLAPTPWQSGSIRREQGVSKAGNPRLRTTLVQLSWLWLQHQPKSSLSQWYRTRVERNGGRMKKTTIVALARKLLVALWRYTTSGVVIEGAVIREA
jgi:transposase